MNKMAFSEQAKNPLLPFRSLSSEQTWARQNASTEKISVCVEERGKGNLLNFPPATNPAHWNTINSNIGVEDERKKSRQTSASHVRDHWRIIPVRHWSSSGTILHCHPTTTITKQTRMKEVQSSLATEKKEIHRSESKTLLSFDRQWDLYVDRQTGNRDR